MLFGWLQGHTSKTHFWNILDKYELQQQSLLGTVSYKQLGGLDGFYMAINSPSASAVVHKIQLVLLSSW